MSHITVRWMPEAKPPLPPIMIETLGSNYIISIAEAKALALGLEQAIVSAEAGEELLMCTCGGRPYLFVPEPGARSWKVGCTRCRRVNNMWSSRPEAVRMWNEKVRKNE